MLNMSFSVWMMVTEEPLSFELGIVENDPAAGSNPPSIEGTWHWRQSADSPLNYGDDFEIKIEHFKYWENENPHYFRFTHKDVNYNGNIQNYDEETNKFELFLYECNANWARSEKSVRGLMDPNGTIIEWGDVNVQNESLGADPILFKGYEFVWPQSNLPRGRGCHNFGPLDKENYPLFHYCGTVPQMGSYDGTNFEFTEAEGAIFDERMANGSSACPRCDEKAKWEKYFACSKRYESASAENKRCKDFASKLQTLPIGALGDAVNAICKSKLQLCVNFRSVTFSATKIEICPVPIISIVMMKENGDFDKMSSLSFPDGNPVVFACVDFPVTDGLKSEMNPRQKGKFTAAGLPPKTPWYVVYWNKAKMWVFTALGLLFARFLLKTPKKGEGDEFEEFDDEKFFEEYGEFYSSEESMVENSNDLYDDMY